MARAAAGMQATKGDEAARVTVVAGRGNELLGAK